MFHFQKYNGCQIIPLSKQQRRLGLGVVVAGRGAADDHGGTRVTAQTLL